MRKLSLFDPETHVFVVAPASPPHDPKSIEGIIEKLSSFGCSVTVAPQIYARHGYLAGEDSDRAFALQAALNDEQTDIIYCLRGGYGSVRLLPLLAPLSTLNVKPKVVVGFSDITTLHAAFYSNPSWIGLHGPDLASLVKADGGEAFRLDSLHKALDPHTSYSVTSTESIESKAPVRGELIGGNLSNLAALCGTPFAPSFAGRIVFLEEVQEAPYRIDRYLTQLLMASDIKEAAAIVVGCFSACNDPHAATAVTARPTWREVVEERLARVVPVLFGFPIGHVPFNATLPLGRLATLDLHKGELLVECAR